MIRNKVMTCLEQDGTDMLSSCRDVSAKNIVGNLMDNNYDI